jgi:hypothetical protein
MLGLSRTKKRFRIMLLLLVDDYLTEEIKVV